MGEQKPSIFQPVMLTIVALLDLVTAFLFVAGDTMLVILLFILLTEVFLIAIAIYSWVKYFKTYIRYEIENSMIKKDNL